MLLLHIIVAAFLSATINAADICGKRSVISKKLLSNGYSAGLGSWPWHGALLRRNRDSSTYLCGITIISSNAVLTAAHCVYNPSVKKTFPSEEFYVKVGVTNLKKPGKEVKEYNVSEIVEHPKYEHASAKNDLAVLKLQTQIEFSVYVQPICLWRGDSSLSMIVNQSGIVVGWIRSNISEMATDLMVASTKVVSEKSCVQSNPNIFRSIYHENRTFCVDHPNKTSFYSGDSGNGLYIAIDGVWAIRGIVSAAKFDPNKLSKGTKDFSVLTDVSVFTHWIRSKITTSNTKTPPKNDKKDNLLKLSKCGTLEKLNANQLKFPWLGLLNYRRNYSVVEKIRPCGAILIHPSFVLTSGSCMNHEIKFYQSNLKNETTVFGENNNNISPVDQVFIHPDYDARKKSNYIALVKLKSVVSSMPICLPPFSSKYPADNRLHVPFLQIHDHKINLELFNISLVNCSKDYASRFPDSRGIRCVSYALTQERECSYLDLLLSSPIQTLHWDKYYGLAVSSFGPRCPSLAISDGYTNLMVHLEWIAKTVKENS